MTERVLSGRFFDDSEAVELGSEQGETLDAIGLLPTVPKMGGRRVPASIEEEFGSCARKLVVKPVLAVYKAMEEGGLLYVHGLVYQRQVRRSMQARLILPVVDLAWSSPL